MQPLPPWLGYSIGKEVSTMWTGFLGGKLLSHPPKSIAADMNKEAVIVVIITVIIIPSSCVYTFILS